MIKHSNSNIYYSPKKIKKILNQSIDFTLEGIQCFCHDPISNFTRERKLPARTLIDSILSFSNYSTASEMSHFFFDYADMPSTSAMCQRRQLLDPVIFKRINNLFVHAFANYRTINGYYILAKTENGTFDMKVTRVLTRLQNKEFKAHKDKYVFVPTTSRFDYLGPTQDFYELSFRIVRFKITDDTYETIITMELIYFHAKKKNADTAGNQCNIFNV